MKRLLLASVTLLALTGTEAVRAADMPPGVIYPALVAPHFTFTGFYVGGTVGGAEGNTKYLETPGGGFGLATPLVAAVGTGSVAPRGVIGGLEGGYNWQAGMFVLGFETDFSGWDMSANSGAIDPGMSVNSKHPESVLISNLSSSTTANSNWLFTARPRVGIANGNMLTYLTGGLAVTNLNLSQSILYCQCIPKNNSTVPPTPASATQFAAAGSFSTTEVGWIVGGGIEYALSWNWLIKAEYLYASFPNQNASQAGSPALTGTLTGDFRASIVRAGLDYRF
jgi:outer membrane immunogenic protein